jgi:hypothetical protein
MNDDDDIPVLTESVEIPVLTEAVELGTGNKTLPVLNEFQMNELRIRLTDSAYGLMERLLYNAIREMENALLEDLANHLRDELPEVIDKILQEHLSTAPVDTNKPDH